MFLNHCSIFKKIIIILGTVYDKKKLIELLRVTKGNNDLEKEEVDIVTGALVYKEKTVRSVMTRFVHITTIFFLSFPKFI